VRDAVVGRVGMHGRHSAGDESPARLEKPGLGATAHEVHAAALLAPTTLL
jgi:hypothetical protein